MGVPCVTMAGSVHAHNVGVSLLTKVGMHDHMDNFRVYCKHEHDLYILVNAENVHFVA